jgi:hypothetical protein
MFETTFESICGSMFEAELEAYSGGQAFVDVRSFRLCLVRPCALDVIAPAPLRSSFVPHFACWHLA